jgi:hypothetical protein
MSNEPPKDPPIEPQDFVGGVKVVDIGDLRVARGFSRRPASVCTHPQLYYDRQERRIWCPDCEQNIEAFDAFEKLVENIYFATDSLNRRSAEIAEAEAHHMVSLAAKVVDKVWRGRREVPACPVCNAGLFPEDFKVRVGATVGREYGAAYRAKIGKPVPGYKPRKAGPRG